MARVSTKENKNRYHKTRESLKLTREAASELLETIAPERIEKIENERCLPHPDEVLLMAEKYKQQSVSHRPAIRTGDQGKGSFADRSGDAGISECDEQAKGTPYRDHRGRKDRR